jgi:nicotinamidase-related amidase
MDLALVPASTALVLIDLQAGIVGRDCAPYPAMDVLHRAASLAGSFRKAGGLVVLVHVGFAPDGGDMLKTAVDAGGPMPMPPPGWDKLMPELDQQPGDLVVCKHNWSAFYGTDLDLQLRRRRIDSIVLGGIATNIGVESTARQAHEHGYSVVFAEDAMTDLTAEGHAHATKVVFPRIGGVRSTADILSALS